LELYKLVKALKKWLLPSMSSPDLIPIKPLGKKIQPLVCDCPHTPLCVSELKIAFFEASDQITEANIDGYVNHMGIGCRLF